MDGVLQFNECATEAKIQNRAKDNMFPKFRTAWKEFVRSLTRSRDPFNPYVWIYRLASAFLEDLGLDRFRSCWRPVVPIFALVLIGAVSASYFFVFRYTIIEKRWCEEPSSTLPNRTNCSWMRFHDLVVIYLLVMTATSFLRAKLTSPGVHVSDHSKPSKKFNPSAEKALVARFGDFQRQMEPIPPPRSNIFVHPSPYPSRCDACDHLRPPRCHHCKICNCCVLVYDHHCFFLDQCIGYNNYIPFFQCIFFVTLGCWYGVALLCKPFYAPVLEYLNMHGGLRVLIHSSISHGRVPPGLSNLLSVPSLREFWDIITVPNHPMLHQTILDAVFPLIFAVGTMMTIFLISHVKYACRATTTLEHRIALDRMFRSLAKRFVNQQEPEERWANPFDQGSAFRNWSQVFGSNLLLLFLPISIPTPPPYIGLKKDA